MLDLQTVRTTVHITPRPGVMTDGADGVVRRVNGKWRMTNIGTSGVGCELPSAVRRDLKFNNCS